MPPSILNSTLHQISDHNTRFFITSLKPGVNSIKLLTSEIYKCSYYFRGGGAVVWWLARWTSDPAVGGSSLVTAVVLFP